jgi:hypothetical protein
MGNCTSCMVMNLDIDNQSNIPRTTENSKKNPLSYLD